MKLRPSAHLTEAQINDGLKLVIKDGLAAEAMTTLTGGAFLVALAIYMGASNFQIGLLAALPTFTNILQVVAIWLVQKYNNRRAIAVFCNLFARLPLLVIGLLPFLFSSGTSLPVLIFLLFFHYLFGSISGPSWNSWMKDLVPQNQLGTYFSHRSRLTQSLNVTLSLVIAMTLDFIKSHYPQQEVHAYAIMFIAGGILGMIGVYMLYRTPEPKSYLVNENIFKLFVRPLKDKNFRGLLMFQSFWSFALNMATPFFSVYMMKKIGLPLSYIIGLGILSQISSIFSIKMWGRYSDRFSNKTIISVCAPIYIFCILAWSFTASPGNQWLAFSLLIGIHILTGVSTAGINLAIGNMGMKLAPKEEAVVYLAARSVTVALVSAMAPIIGGLLADFFANHQLIWNIEWQGPAGVSQIPLLHLHHWNFLFIIGAMLALLSLRLLKKVKEEGEVERDVVVTEMRVSFKNNIKGKMGRPAIRMMFHHPLMFPAYVRKHMSRREGSIYSFRKVRA